LNDCSWEKQPLESDYCYSVPNLALRAPLATSTMVVLISPLAASCLPLLTRNLALFVGHALPKFASFCPACLLGLSVFRACCLTFLVSHILARLASLFAHSFTLLGRHVPWVCGRRVLSQNRPGE
jgi:hypothetical protein